MFHATLHAALAAPRALVAAVLFTVLSCGCGGSDTLTPQDAARTIRNSPTFGQRAGSLAGRELVEVLTVRRLGRDSAEIEFTWRDAPAPPGGSARPIKPAMALFRRTADGTWVLASLYKVD